MSSLSKNTRYKKGFARDAISDAKIDPFKILILQFHKEKRPRNTFNIIKTCQTLK